MLSLSRPPQGPTACACNGAWFRQRSASVQPRRRQPCHLRRCPAGFAYSSGQSLWHLLLSPKADAAEVHAPTNLLFNSRAKSRRLLHQVSPGYSCSIVLRSRGGSEEVKLRRLLRLSENQTFLQTARSSHRSWCAGVHGERQLHAASKEELLLC